MMRNARFEDECRETEHYSNTGYLVQVFLLKEQYELMVISRNEATRKIKKAETFLTLPPKIRPY